MGIMIDKHFLEQAVPQLLEQFGTDYVYPGAVAFSAADCRYVKGGQPSCLVGHVLHMAGVPIQALAFLDSRPIDDNPEDTAGTNAADAPGFLRDLCDIDITVEPSCVLALDIMQRTQDAGHTWGSAWDQARTVLA